MRATRALPACADPGLTDLIVAEVLVRAVAVGLVGAVLALAKVKVLALLALESQRGELAALVGTVAKRLLAGEAAHAKVIFLAGLERDLGGFVIGNGGVGDAVSWQFAEIAAKIT